jgi:hypothetical protein
MSDEEMNIDEGTFVDPFPLTLGHLILSLKWPMEVVPSGKEVVVFRVQQVCCLALCSALRLSSHANVITLSWQRRWRWVRTNLRPRGIGASARCGYPSGTM